MMLWVIGMTHHLHKLFPQTDSLYNKQTHTHTHTNTLMPQPRTLFCNLQGSCRCYDGEGYSHSKEDLIGQKSL